MDVDVLFASMAVSDFETALRWYERFFGRPADIVAHQHEVMWRVTQQGWLYIVQDRGRAGHSVATMAVPDIEEAAVMLDERGIAIGPIEAEGDAGRKALVVDPDGNSIAVIEVAPGG